MSTAALARQVKPTAAGTGPTPLRVNSPGDTYEQEADRAAEHVVSRKAPGAAWSLSRISMRAPLQRECACGGTCEECKSNGAMLQRDAAGGKSPATAPPLVHDVLRGQGRPLERSTRGLMESGFGHDFSKVRIFDDAAAANSARTVSANAFTVGDKIVFDRGKYAPESAGGQRLLAHELAHVVQQNSAAPGAAGILRRKEEDTPADGLSPVHQMRSSGRPLDRGTRSVMERRFGQSFDEVRVHTGSEAGSSALSAGAGAYTVGNDIAFAPGFYSPETQGGRVVLAHELAHVVQQGWGGQAGAANSAVAESEALSAGESVGRARSSVAIRQSARRGFAAMSIAEARQALWGHVPDTVKEYVRPIAHEAAVQMDKVVSPDTQIPKPVENLVEHPVDTLVQAVEHPLEAAHAVETTVQAVKPAAQKAVGHLATVVKAQVKKKIHDEVMGAAGTVKGVALEATNLVDTVAWVPHAAHELEKKALGDSAAAQAVISASDSFTGYAALSSLVQAGYSAKDPITGKPTGAFAISATVSNAFDVEADKAEKVLGDGKPEEALLFNSYEEGELKGAIGTQVALAFVGAEEAQLALKAVGALGAVKNVFDAVEANPKGWYKDFNFWSGIVMLVLTILGLGAAQASKKIVGIIVAGTGLASIIPLVWQLYSDYRKLPEGPERDKRLKQDYGGIIKALGGLIMSLVQHGGAKGAAGAGEPEPRTGGAVKEMVAAPGAPAQAALVETAPKAAAVAPVEAAAKPTAPASGGASEEPAAPLEAAARQAPPAEAAGAKAVVPPEAASRGAAPQPGAGELAMGHETPASEQPVRKEDALAKSAVHDPGAAEEHEIVATKDGLGRCSDSPCPAISVVYRDDLAVNKSFADRYRKIRGLGETNPQAATEQMAKLASDIESARRQAVVKNFPPHADPDRATSREQWKRMEGERRKGVGQNREIDEAFDKAGKDHPLTPKVKGTQKSGFYFDDEAGTSVPKKRWVKLDMDPAANLENPAAEDVAIPRRQGESGRDAAARVRTVVGKTIAEIPELARIWEDVRSRILSETPLTEDNYGSLYKRAQQLLWERVQGVTPQGDAARKAIARTDAAAAQERLAAAGFGNQKGSVAPVLEGTDPRLRVEEIRISLDHKEEKAIGENWQKALDADNIQLEIEMVNKERENTQQRHPELRPGAKPPGDIGR